MITLAIIIALSFVLLFGASVRRVVTPLACISLMIGMMFAAKRSALALLAATPSACPVELFCTLCPCCCHAEPASDPDHRLRVPP